MKTQAIHKGPFKVAGLGLVGRVMKRGSQYIMEVRNADVPDIPHHWKPILENENSSTREVAEGLYVLLSSMPKVMEALEVPASSGNVQALVTHRGLHNSNSTLAELRVWNLSTRKTAHVYIDSDEGLCIDT